MSKRKNINHKSPECGKLGKINVDSKSRSKISEKMNHKKEIKT